MRKYLKYFVAIAMILCVVCAGFIAGNAAESSAALFTVTDSEGNTVEYYNKADFSKMIIGAPSGSTIRLCKTIELGMAENSSMELEATEEEPREIFLDLAGFGIYNKEKMTLFSVGSYTTLNVYSSAPGGFMYTIAGPSWGGCIFAISGTGSLVNCGTMTINDVTYPGSNLSTFSSCFINMVGTGTLGFRGVSGNHFAAAADWKGFICPRSGDGTISFTDSNIVVIACNQLIHSEVDTTKLVLDNCVLVTADGSSGYLLNQALAPIYFKNCVSNYSIVSKEAASKPTVHLEGENIFGSALGFDSSLVVDVGDRVLAKVVKDYTFIGGESSIWAFDGVGNLKETTVAFPTLTDACVLLAPEDTIDYTWEYDDKVITEKWHKDVKPNHPIELEYVHEEGLYRSMWARIVTGERSVTYRGGVFADFSIKVAAEYDGRVRYYVFLPAFVIDDGYLDFMGVSIDGASYTRQEWEAVTLDGEKYYMTTTPSVEEEEADRPINVVIPCDFVDRSGKSVRVETTWVLTLSEYVDRVYAEEERWSEEELALVNDMVTLLETLKENNTEDLPDNIAPPPADGSSDEE